MNRNRCQIIGKKNLGEPYSLSSYRTQVLIGKYGFIAERFRQSSYWSNVVGSTLGWVVLRIPVIGRMAVHDCLDIITPLHAVEWVVIG